MGFWANSRAILTQGLPLSYCLALENISERSEVEVLPSQSPGGYQEEEDRESRLFAHYKKAGAEGKGQKLPGGGWLQFTEGIAEVKGQGIGGMIRSAEDAGISLPIRWDRVCVPEAGERCRNQLQALCFSGRL